MNGIEYSRHPLGVFGEMIREDSQRDVAPEHRAQRAYTVPMPPAPSSSAR